MEQYSYGRDLRWDACRNVRDLGGLPTLDGTNIAWGALVRADNLCQLTESGRVALLAHGIGTIIDIPFPHEVALEPHPFEIPANSEGALTSTSL